MSRDLREGDGVLVRDNEAMSIIEKVRADGASRRVESVCSVTKPFGLTMRSELRRTASPSPFEGAIPLIYDRSSRVQPTGPDPAQSPSGSTDWKVLLPTA